MTVDVPVRTATTSTVALGTTAVLAVTDARALDAARQAMAAELADLDAACSRFRADSEISLLHAARGTR